MMASFVPKPVSINLPQGPNKGMVSGSVSEEQILTSTSYPTHPPGQQSVQQTSIYENSPRAINPTDKKLNGNLVPSPSLSGNQQIQGQAQGRPPNTANNVAPPSNISNSTGEPVSPEVLPGSGTRGHPSGTGVNPASGMQFLTLFIYLDYFGVRWCLLLLNTYKYFQMGYRRIKPQVLIPAVMVLIIT